jgi:hypothetical protein
VLLGADDPLTLSVMQAVRHGDAIGLRALLGEHSGLANASIAGRSGERRTLLHVATDWPGHFPNNVATVQLLIERGAEVNARFVGTHTETPLHRATDMHWVSTWAVSHRSKPPGEAELTTRSRTTKPAKPIADLLRWSTGPRRCSDLPLRRRCGLVGR